MKMEKASFHHFFCPQILYICLRRLSINTSLHMPPWDRHAAEGYTYKSSDPHNGPGRKVGRWVRLTPEDRRERSDAVKSDLSLWSNTIGRRGSQIETFQSPAIFTQWHAPSAFQFVNINPWNAPGHWAVENFPKQSQTKCKLSWVFLVVKYIPCKITTLTISECTGQQC